jgi:hypothetical protein
MKKFLFSTTLTLILFSFNSNAQTSIIDFGIKGGVNYSKFTPDIELQGITVVNYKRKFGFFVGGFMNLHISEKMQFQPELLIAMQGTGILIEDMEIRIDPHTPPIYSDFKSNLNDLTLSLPLVFRYFFSESYFVEGGAQLGYILDRNDKVKSDPLIENSRGMDKATQYGYDKLEIGVAVGTGYKLSEKINLVGRFFLGLNKRDNNIKSSVFNLGLEYTLL